MILKLTFKHNFLQFTKFVKNPKVVYDKNNNINKKEQSGI